MELSSDHDNLQKGIGSVGSVNAYMYALLVLYINMCQVC